MNEQERKVNEWHDEAMDTAEMAFSARRRKEFEMYCKLTQKALNLEKAAARLMYNLTNIEPSRSVLYQSAAWLAINIDAFDDAEQLIYEALLGNPPYEIAAELREMETSLEQKRKIRKTVLQTAQMYLNMADETNIDENTIRLALESAYSGIERFISGNIDQLLNKPAVEVSFRGKQKVSAPDYQIFEGTVANDKWIVNTERSTWGFWQHYREYLGQKNIPVSVIKKTDMLTTDILSRLGAPSGGKAFDRRGMIVGDVQSGKTSNYIGLINKAADAGYRIIIVLSGLYESLRKQTQIRVDEGFTGKLSKSGDIAGVGKLRSGNLPPVHPKTHSDPDGDIKMKNLRNDPLNTGDYYALVIKKNPTVLKSLLSWFVNSPLATEVDGTLLIRNIPVLVIDDEADYASLNISKESASTINACIRALLGLFDQSAFVGYTATPFANVFIEDINQTKESTLAVGGKRVKLGEELFPKDFVINLPPPTNYIGYQKVFNTSLEDPQDEEKASRLMFVNFISGDSPEIPEGHRKNDDLPNAIPDTLKRAVCCFVIVCATRMARGQQKDHNSMLIHISWYIRWINKVAELVNDYVSVLKDSIRYDPEFPEQLHRIWQQEFSGKSEIIASGLGYDDPLIRENVWEEIMPNLKAAVEKIEVRAVHGNQKNLPYTNCEPLDYEKHEDGLWVIAVGGNKLSRGLTLESLSVSYFLRATRFYDTLLQMGRWFGYRPGYADLCRVFTTEDLVLWYQYIAKATEDLKDQFDIMELADRTPKNYGHKVWKAPGKILMVSSPAKTRSGTDLELSFSAQLLETYLISKDRNILRNNITAAAALFGGLGEMSGKIRQGQQLIWENVPLHNIDNFIKAYQIRQGNLSSVYLRAYFAQQAEKGHLLNWTVVFISNSTDRSPYTITSGEKQLTVGRTLRQERIFEDKDGKEYTRQDIYWIRKSHIISPPHEYLDMNEDDTRLLAAKRDAGAAGTRSLGKFVRKHRGGTHALLVVYLLDPSGFGGGELPAVGYAISLPSISDKDDQPVSYLANRQYVEEITAIYRPPEDASEDVEGKSDGL